jgi:DNA-binding beta-propeller fold protein YncE
MKRRILTLAVIASLAPAALPAVAGPLDGITKQWTFTHNIGAGQTSEIVSFDAVTNSLWVAGVAGVDVLNASNGSLIQHIDTTAYGSINSVAIHNGLAAFAIESTVDRTAPGVIKFYDTGTRALAGGVNSVTVGALPDMLTFTPNGGKLLVANEGTPTVYGARIGTSVPRIYGAAANDPAGSVSIIDMATRSVTATATLAGVAISGANIRTNTGMDYEPEYIAVNAAGTKAYVTLQEANAVGVLDLASNSFTKIVGLGAKDFSATGNQIDPLNNGTVSFISPSVKGLYMPDGIAAYQSGGRTFLVMANEGDFREDDADRSAASSLGALAPLNALRISNTDSSAGDLYAVGGRSFSIRDAEGNLVFDSGDRLDKEAAARGIYDDGRSRDKGVEPEGVALKEIGGRTYAFIGLERTTKGAVAIYDVTDPATASFVDMIVTDGDLAPEGMTAFTMGGTHYLAIANETSGTTTLYNLAPVPEPEAYALMLAGLGLVGFLARRRRA